MKKRLILLAALAATALSGCAMDMGGGVATDVAATRFHLGQPIARGEIRVEGGEAVDMGAPELVVLAVPVERELTRLGWTVTRGNARSEQVAVVRLRQGRREASSGSGLSIGIGGGTGGYRSGVSAGVGATIPIGGSGPIVISELSVRIQRRSDGSVAWEGRAITEARETSPLASPQAAADRLATALFQDFPGESGRTIRVR